MWLTGIIDGEGHMGIYTRKCKSSNNLSYYELIQVDMNSEEVIRRIYELVGEMGSVYSTNRRSGTYGKTVWRWAVKNAQAREVLEKIKPHLIAKKSEVEIIMNLRTVKIKGKLPPSEIKRREELRLLLHKIRRV